MYGQTEARLTCVETSGVVLEAEVLTGGDEDSLLSGAVGKDSLLTRAVVLILLLDKDAVLSGVVVLSPAGVQDP